MNVPMLLSNHCDNKSLSPLILWTKDSPQTSIETNRNYRYLWIDTFSQGVIKICECPHAFEQTLWQLVFLYEPEIQHRHQLKLLETVDICELTFFSSECFLQLGQRRWRGCRWKNQQVSMFKTPLFLCYWQASRIS